MAEFFLRFFISCKRWYISLIFHYSHCFSEVNSAEDNWIRIAKKIKRMLPLLSYHLHPPLYLHKHPTWMKHLVIAFGKTHASDTLVLKNKTWTHTQHKLWTPDSVLNWCQLVEDHSRNSFVHFRCKIQKVITISK